MKRSFIISTGIMLMMSMALTDRQERSIQMQPKENSIVQRLPSLKTKTDFGKIPLYFIPNEGQLDEKVAFYIQGKDKTLYFTSGGVTFALTPLGKDKANRSLRELEPEDQKLHTPDNPRFMEEQYRRSMSIVKEPAERWVVKLHFVDANLDVKPQGLDQTGGIVSYFKGKPENWHTRLMTYSKIRYENLWPGIDLVYSGEMNRLKYDFVVHPGADPSQIRLAYRGVDQIGVDEAGRLEMTTPGGSFQDDMPVAYQEVGGKKIDVTLSYKLKNAAAKAHEYGFEIEDYDRTQPLIIDPAILIYCGYLGGSDSEYAYGIAVDDSGNAYITGFTSSTAGTFPETVGPDLTPNGSVDVFVAKVNSSGTALIYCGYIGGSDTDFGKGIAVDSSGCAYITGETSSDQSSFPVFVGPDLTHNGNNDGFVAKVNASGTTLLYCGYIGGESFDYGHAVAVDDFGAAYITGGTGSDENSFPVVGGPDLIHNGYGDCFVAKVNSSGDAFLFCGYIGGSGFDCGNAIALDSSNNVYIAGETESDEVSFPVHVGPYLIHKGYEDVFVAKVNSSATALIYCGYIGGSNWDYGNGISVDSLGNAYIAGSTGSNESSFPVAVGPLLTFGGIADAFVAKLNSLGTALVYCGYIGGSSMDYGYACTLDIRGNAYITGYTESTEASFPVVGGPGLVSNGNGDAFIAKVNISGTAFVACGYIGGSNDDRGTGIAVDIEGNVFMTGRTASTQADFPVRIGPDLTYNGSYDAFMTKVSYWELWDPIHAVGDFDGDGADEAAVDFGAAGIFLYDGGSWTQLSGANPEGLMAADVDGDSVAELLADLGAGGLWLWNAEAWNQVSGVNVEGMAAGDVDTDGADEVVGDFGTVGMWLYNGGTWIQLSGVNADYINCADLDGSGGEEIIGDFGATGLWIWNTGAWTQLSGVNADYVAFGNTDGTIGEELIGDFGATGLWLWSQGSGWLQLSGVNADYIITGDVDGNGDDELFGDFAATGLWCWDSGAWTQLSGVDADFMIRADVDANGDSEVLGDYGAIGLWLVNGGSWTQLSGANAEYLMAGDLDGDNADEVMVDFGSLGLWLWNGGAWSQISANNPD